LRNFTTTSFRSVSFSGSGYDLDTVVEFLHPKEGAPLTRVHRKRFHLGGEFQLDLLGRFRHDVPRSAQIRMERSGTFLIILVNMFSNGPLLSYLFINRPGRHTEPERKFVSLPSESTEPVRNVVEQHTFDGSTVPRSRKLNGEPSGMTESRWNNGKRQSQPSHSSDVRHTLPSFRAPTC
jgi:hypothetical protein